MSPIPTRKLRPQLLHFVDTVHHYKPYILFWEHPEVDRVGQVTVRRTVSDRPPVGREKDFCNKCGMELTLGVHSTGVVLICVGRGI
jgi:hypothetical protein